MFVVYLAFGSAVRGAGDARLLSARSPQEIDESARIDGLHLSAALLEHSHAHCQTAVASLFIMDFLSTWNEYMLASILITDISAAPSPTA
jgi:raffinose/stachyose/melibiose transport system permease protein